MNRNLLIGIVALVVVALGVGAYFAFSGPDPNALAPGANAANVTLTPEDRAMGNPKAKLTVVEYAAPTCPHCAHFNAEVMPKLKEKYIDTGKVYFVFRVFPLNAVDLAAEALARCLPAENYHHFIDLLFRNQDKWSPEYQVLDVHGGLVSMARIAGMGSEQADRCMQDKAQLDRANQVGADGQKRYNIRGTPTFIINGKTYGGGYEWEAMQKALDAMLKES